MALQRSPCHSPPPCPHSAFESLAARSCSGERFLSPGAAPQEDVLLRKSPEPSGVVPARQAECWPPLSANKADDGAELGKRPGLRPPQLWFRGRTSLRTQSRPPATNNERHLATVCKRPTAWRAGLGQGEVAGSHDVLRGQSTVCFCQGCWHMRSTGPGQLRGQDIGSRTPQRQQGPVYLSLLVGTLPVGTFPEASCHPAATLRPGAWPSARAQRSWGLPVPLPEQIRLIPANPLCPTTSWNLSQCGTPLPTARAAGGSPPLRQAGELSLPSPT